MVSDKNLLLGRDEHDKPIPVEVSVPDLGTDATIVVTLMPRGEIMRLRTLAQADPEKAEEEDRRIVVDHVINPKLSKEEVDLMPMKNIQAVVWAILAASTGKTYEEMKNASNRAEVLSEAEEFVKKK